MLFSIDTNFLNVSFKTAKGKLNSVYSKFQIRTGPIEELDLLI